MEREVKIIKIKTTLTLRFRPILLEEHFENGKRYLVDEFGNRWDMTEREANEQA